MKDSLLPISIITIIGALFIFFSLAFIKRQKAILRNSITVDAKVSEVIKEISNCSPSYIPVFEFMLDEKHYTIKYNVGYATPKFYIGQVVNLEFNPDYDDEVVLSDDWFTYNLPKILLCIGILAVLIGIRYYIRSLT